MKNFTLLCFLEWLYTLLGYQQEEVIIKPHPPAQVLGEGEETYSGGTLPEVVVTAPRTYVLEWMTAAQRAFGYSLQIEQVRALTKAWHLHGTGDNRHLAYIFATIWHECKFEPKNEVRANPFRQPDLYRQQSEYWKGGYFGRGPIQLTWIDNYRRFGKHLGLPLVEKPELLNRPDVGYPIAVIGMVRGWFTGAPLRWYINDRREDYYKARRTVNGDEHKNGVKIAQHAKRILAEFNLIIAEEND